MAQRAAIIVNPTKFDDADRVRQLLERVCREHGWDEPLWIETTADDPGTGQAKQALDAGVDLVCPLGGDGTVRAVAATMVDSQVPVGLLPGGTGNLLARNLELPIDTLEAAMTVALTGRDKAIDVGLINVTAPDDVQDKGSDYIFLVMAGMGFDANVMAGTSDKLKKAVGWIAYLEAGLRYLNGPRFAAGLAFDDQPARKRRVNSILVGNVGKVQMNVKLVPDAEVDDGKLDAMIFSPKGAVGWIGVAAAMATGNRKGHRRIEHQHFEKMRIVLDSPQELQLDGDPIGPARAVSVGVKPACLIMRANG